MNLTQNDNLNQVTADTFIVELILVHKSTSQEHLIGDVLSSPNEFFVLVIRR